LAPNFEHIAGLIAVVRERIGQLVVGPETVVAGRYTLPADLSPFSVIKLLRCMVADDQLSVSGRSELQEQIDRLEAWFFADLRGGETPGASGSARSWVRRLG